MSGEPEIKLGPCCHCGRADGDKALVMFPRRGPTPGKGWGCFACGLPFDGAVAILCDACVARDDPPKWVCTGYPAEPGRTPYADLDADVFEHDARVHAVDQMDGWGPP